MAFRLRGLDPAAFARYATLDAAELARHDIHRLVVDQPETYPCRVSLDDARVGERLLLLPFAHHAAACPYRASGPIFVREGVPAADLPAGQVPEGMRGRLFSIRAYREDGMMVDAEVIPGDRLEPLIDRFFGLPEIAMLHAHHARRGCYAFRIDRV